MNKKKVIIMGAAGRDFHNFNTRYRDNPDAEVIAFTAAQIPFIDDRIYPPELSGPLYPDGIPIYLENELSELIEEHSIDIVEFSYSDVAHEDVMHKASLVTASGADFVLAGSESTMLKSSKPVISVCAVRTGCGKSAVTRLVSELITKSGKRAVAVRHPMPYGDLAKQKVQRFASIKDMQDAECTIEEMEEYEHLIDSGIVVYAGVDYGAILKKAEEEADIIIWDGGNNDTPFYVPDLEIVIADPMRPGHEITYYPGETNIRRADCVIINKVDSADPDDTTLVAKNITHTNPSAVIIETESQVKVEDEDLVRGKRVLVIEDGPTLTHGGMMIGAGVVAAYRLNATPVDPRHYSVGSIRETLMNYPALKELIPAMGYSAEQLSDLETSINLTPCDVVLIATPIDLAGKISINKPVTRVTYSIVDTKEPGIVTLVNDFLSKI